MAEQKHLCYNCFQAREVLEGPCPYCGFDLAENERKFPVALRAGTVLNDRYIVGRVLGQGGFGITYLALDTQLNAKVAIKEFMPGEIATRVGGTTVSVMMDTRREEFTYGAERFQEEARTLAKFIGNPNIAAVTSYFDENDTSYFVMDYIEGISFKTYIANHGGKISVEETLNVMIPVLRALTAVHAEGFIHRDVTPDNIYITKDGMVKLLDFGSARYSIGDKSKSLDVILKVGYAPKEQYIRRSRQGPFTDVYSCAACFYAALTGFLPPESLERMDEDTLVPISQCGIDIPEYLDKAILKGLAVQPEDRFQSAAEFLDAIESQQVVEVPASGGVAPAPAPEKKKIKPALIAAIAVAVVVVFALGSLFGGGGGGSESGGDVSDALPPLIQAEVPFVTIAGQEYSTDERHLEIGTDAPLSQEDLDQLGYMVNLVELYITLSDSYTVPDFSALASIPNLQVFTINGELPVYDPLDLSPLRDLTHLQSLRINPSKGANGIKGVDSLSFLTGLTDLESLKITISPEVKDLSPLSGLTKLTDLSLFGRFPAPDLGFLSGMSALNSLELWVEDVQDLSTLESLSELKMLDINFSSSVIDDISVFAKIEGLQSLTVQMSSGAEENVPLSLEPLGHMTNLQELSFYASGYVTGDDLSPFASLTGLRKLNLTVMSFDQGNYAVRFSDLSPLAALTKLEDLSITPVAENVDRSSVSFVPTLNLQQ